MGVEPSPSLAVDTIDGEAVGRLGEESAVAASVGKLEELLDELSVGGDENDDDERTRTADRNDSSSFWTPPPSGGKLSGWGTGGKMRSAIGVSCSSESSCDS